MWRAYILECVDIDKRQDWLRVFGRLGQLTYAALAVAPEEGGSHLLVWRTERGLMEAPKTEMP